MASIADHAARMDHVYRVQRHIYDATRKYYLLGRDQLISELSPPVNGAVLEVGCGTGRNLIAAARRWPEARLFGLDISPMMLETAATNIARAGYSDRIRLAQADATDFSGSVLFDTSRFDRIFQSYTLSMIPDWRTAIACAAGQLTPLGTLTIVDFGQQEALPTAFRAGLHRWLTKFEVTPRAALFEAAQAVAVAQGLSADCRPLYRGYAWSVKLTAPHNHAA